MRLGVRSNTFAGLDKPRATHQVMHVCPRQPSAVLHVEVGSKVVQTRAVASSAIFARLVEATHDVHDVYPERDDLVLIAPLSQKRQLAGCTWPARPPDRRRYG